LLALALPDAALDRREAIISYAIQRDALTMVVLKCYSAERLRAIVKSCGWLVCCVVVGSV
jgi:hypothetical protein